MTQQREYPFVRRPALGDAQEWREELSHAANLLNIVRSQGLDAPALRDLLKYALRRALFACLLPDEQANLHQAIARGAGAAHAAVLCQRRWSEDAEGAILMAEPGQAPLRIEAADAGLAIPEWLDGLSLALIARDHAAINTLATPASIEACARSAETTDPFWPPYGAAFAAALVEPQAAVEWVEIAVAAIAEARISPPARITLLDYPLLPVIAGLAERNAAAFNAALFDAVQKHHQYYAQPNQSRNWNGFFSLTLTALCAEASDIGLPIQVRSDYLPEELIAGHFPREFTTVTLCYPVRAVAHADEARWFLDLQGIPRHNRRHTIVARHDQLLARYEVEDAPGLSHAIAEFILPPSDPNEGTTDHAAAKAALDAGELLYLAEIYSSVTESDRQAQRANLLDAVRCVELALQRLPAGGDTTAFHSQRGRKLHAAEPGRFDRERLNAYLNSLQQSLAQLDQPQAAAAATSQPLPAAEDTARAGALVMIEVIRAQLMPLLEALAHDAEGKIVAQIKPRDEDYEHAFVGEAARLARAAYAALWVQQPPRTAQLAPAVEVRCFLAPAGMLADENDLSRHFPQGYRAIAQWLQPQRIWVAWKYLRPGAQSGEAYNGLVWLDDHWAWFPKPFRVLRELAERST